MGRLVVLKAAEQVAAHLRGELHAGTWKGQMPGGDRLAAELGIGADTVEAALRQLEEEGLLVNQGRRRGRLIALEGGGGPRNGLRVAIQLHEPLALSEGYIVELQHLLQEAGFTAFFTEKCLIDLQMDVSKLAGLVDRTTADLWVVVAGPLHVLEWFVGQGLTMMALFGRRRELRIAGWGLTRSVPCGQ